MVVRLNVPDNILYDKQAYSLSKFVKKYGYSNGDLIRVQKNGGRHRLEIATGVFRNITEKNLIRLFDTNPSPRYLELIKFVLDEKLILHKDSYPFKIDEVLVWLGEIPQMPGHCVVVNRSGQVFWGYHTENFELVPNEEA